MRDEKIIVIPKRNEREISFMLHNYEKIEKLIEKRKRDLIDTITVSKQAYLKALHDDNSNTLEDVVIRFDTDYKIVRLKKWQTLINSFISKLYDEEDKTYYYLIKNKYFLNINEEVIQEKLNLTSKQFKDIDIYLKWLIYQKAIESNLFAKGEI